MRKNATTKETFISLKLMLNLPSKNNLFSRESCFAHLRKVQSCPLYFQSIIFLSKSYYSTPVQVIKRPLSQSLPLCFELSCLSSHLDGSTRSSSETSIEAAAEDHNLHSISTFKHEKFIYLLLSRFKSNRTMLRTCLDHLLNM